MEDVEQLRRYGPEGYHPISIGDQLHSRYSVVHKIGFGTHSTVWLARDHHDHVYVAIKIATASGDSEECNVSHRLGTADQDTGPHPGKAMIPRVLDEFVISGPNGKHRCFVTAPARMSLALAKDASATRIFQPTVARAIAAQLIEAVVFLHTQGVVHAGV